MEINKHAGSLENANAVHLAKEDPPFIPAHIKYLSAVT